MNFGHLLPNSDVSEGTGGAASDNGSEWRFELSFAERTRHIQHLNDNGYPAMIGQDAVAIEIDVYLRSSSLEEYRSLMQQPATGISHETDTAASRPTTPDDFFDDARHDDRNEKLYDFGRYSDFKFLNEGVSSAVFHNEQHDLVLKVAKRRVMPPHDLAREAKILRALGTVRGCIEIADSFELGGREIIVMPYYPLNLQTVMDRDGENNWGHYFTRRMLTDFFIDIFDGLKYIHRLGMIHRDIKPSAILIKGLRGPACICDFGTAWHREYSLPEEPAHNKYLDVGTGAYRAPSLLLGNRNYGPEVDLWSVGAMLAEAARPAPHIPLFKSRGVHEDGNQLGLLLDIFKKLGTPTVVTWPESEAWGAQYLDMYMMFPARPWSELLSDVPRYYRDVVAGLVGYQSTERMTAEQACKALQEIKSTYGPLYD